MATIYSTGSVFARTSKFAHTTVFSDGTVTSDSDPAPDPSNFVFGTAIDTQAPHYSTTTHALARQSVLSEISSSVPMQTNQWFVNFFMGSNAVETRPYQVKPVDQGLYLCNPARTVSSTYITTGFLQNMAIEASETIASKKLQSYTDMGVMYKWEVDSTHKMVAPIVKGMAYGTMLFTALTPKITTQHAILNVNGTTSFPADITGTKFKITMNNSQTWILYTSSSVTFNVANSSGWRMLASTTFTGTLQLAYLANSNYETTLDDHALSYASQGVVDAEVSGDTATLTYDWGKVGTADLLHFALPHHIDNLVSPTTTSLSYQDIKGYQTGIVGNTWTISEALTTIGFDPPRAIDSDKVSAIQTALSSDKSYTPDTPNDPYFGGKQLSKVATLMNIAKHSQINDTGALSTLLGVGKTALNAWLDYTNTNKIKYETTWKGICCTNGLASSSSDFGAGYYNDHHFHWGYHIFLAAAIARNDSTWLASYRDKVNVYLRDIMNPSSSDTYFPRFRHTDWYDGHSWAAGLFDFGDNRNQESTSEAINAWYACYLWGLAIGDDNIKDHARILLAMEIRSACKYWQVKAAENIYDSTFEASGVVGVLWDRKVEYTTFFGSLAEYIFGIQMIPITPMLELLLPSAWVTEMYPILDDVFTRTTAASAAITAGGSGYTNGTHNNVTVSTGGATMNIEVTGGAVVTNYGLVNRGTGYTNGQVVTVNAPGGGSGAQATMTTLPEEGWKNFIYASQAIIDKSSAWTNSQALTGFDGGNSKTNQYFWVATRA